MDINHLLKDKSTKATQKREQISNAIESNQVTLGKIKTVDIDDKGVGIILEAMEAVSRLNAEIADIEWLNYAGAHIASNSNTVKREASRVVGNIAYLFPDSLSDTVQKLLKNINNDSTVVRWGSAYALGRIILIPRYANSELFDMLVDLVEQETQNGVKNQYLTGIKKAKQLRK